MKVAIVIVSFVGDLPYLVHNLKSIRKFATGFSELVLVVPLDEVDKFHFEEFGPRIVTYNRSTDRRKWHIHAQAQKCLSDRHCPDADFILHTDSDCIFTQPVTPEDYFIDGKPVMLMQHYDELPSEIPWRKVVQSAMGFDPVYEFMRRHPQVNPVSLYPAMRQYLERKYRMDFERWVLTLHPEFPWGITEHNFLGAFAFWQTEFHDRYHWIDVGQSPGSKPSEKLAQFWSHLPPEKPQETSWGNNLTPCEVFDRLGV